MEELLEAERFAGLDQKVQVRLIEVAMQRAYGKPSEATRTDVLSRSSVVQV